MIRPREEFLKRGSCVMYSEERRRRRNIKTWCVSLEMAVAEFLKTWCTPSCCVSFSFFFFSFFFNFFYKGLDSKGSRESWKEVWSRFSELWGLIVVRMGPCFFSIEQFLRLKEPQKWAVRGFPSQIVWFGLGFKTLVIGGNSFT